MEIDWNSLIQHWILWIVGLFPALEWSLYCALFKIPVTSLLSLTSLRQAACCCILFHWAHLTSCSHCSSKPISVLPSVHSRLLSLMMLVNQKARVCFPVRSSLSSAAFNKQLKCTTSHLKWSNNTNVSTSVRLFLHIKVRHDVQLPSGKTCSFAAHLLQVIMPHHAWLLAWHLLSSTLQREC